MQTLNGTKRARRSEFERCVQPRRTRSQPDTLTRVSIDETGTKKELLPLPGPSKKAFELPGITLLEPPANELDPIDVESDGEEEPDEVEATDATNYTQVSLCSHKNIILVLIILSCSRHELS